MDNNEINILIIDDEVKIIEVVKSFLEKKGFTTFVAENGKKALELFELKNISIILLDLMLPDISGEEICSIIRKKSPVPIIMLTAKFDESDMLKGFAFGADDYITKPFGLSMLNAKIEAVLRRTQKGWKPLFNVMSFNGGDLEIDFEGYTIKKAGMLVNLTPNEFKILSAITKHPNKVFTRDMLINNALGDDFDGLDRVVDSHIKNIRQKIENDPKNPLYIKTIHGIGYKFDGQ